MKGPGVGALVVGGVIVVDDEVVEAGGVVNLVKPPTYPDVHRLRGRLCRCLLFSLSRNSKWHYPSPFIV